jgi:hypothetical protein
LDPAQYCRAIETYLCQKNDGHLIRVVGPSFDLVSRWASDGIPLKVAFSGIDRCFDRYYRKGPRRRPVRIDFCEADVRDVFDEWRRATGLIALPSTLQDGVGPARKGMSLPEHLARVVTRLTNARATGGLGPSADVLIDELSRELDRTRERSGGVRGDARKAALARLEAADRALLACAVERMDDSERAALEREAEQELTAFRSRLSPDAFQRARQAAVDQLVRDKFGLPTITFS